jgi:hypothetical protein
MAASYPMNLSGKQFLFDTDGTYGQILNSNRSFKQELTASQLRNTCDWNLVGTNGYYVLVDYPVSQNIYWNLLFPQPRTITNFSMNYDLYVANLNIDFRYSTNTVNGTDGTWTSISNGTLVTQFKKTTESKMRMPEAIGPFTNVKGVEFNLVASPQAGVNDGYIYMYCFNLFGQYTPNGLEYWDATLNQPLNPNTFNFGDVARGAVYIQSFRLKNNNAQQANNVVVSAATPSAGDMQPELQFKTSGSYATSVTLTSIDIGAISEVITIKRSPSPSSPMNVFNNCRIQSIVGTWT